MKRLTLTIVSLGLIAAGIYPLISQAGRIEEATSPRTEVNPNDYRALKFKCTNWKQVCTGKMRCIEYSYAYSGCYWCKKMVLMENGKYRLRKLQTCQYSRKRGLVNDNWTCKQYYHNPHSPHTADRYCMKWSRDCRYICTKRLRYRLY